MKSVEVHDDNTTQVSVIYRRSVSDNFIVTSSNDGAIYLWEGDNKYEEVNMIEEEETWAISCFDYNEEEDIIVYACNSKLKKISKIVLFDLNENDVKHTYSDYTVHINDIKTEGPHIYVAFKAETAIILPIIPDI